MDIMGPDSRHDRRAGAGGSGTLYNLLEQFMEAGDHPGDPGEGRRRSYILTEKGKVEAESTAASAPGPGLPPHFGRGGFS